ncbi:MAG: hypothetical protein ACWA6U_16585 [Breznakibacter sp.]
MEKDVSEALDETKQETSEAIKEGLTSAADAVNKTVKEARQEKDIADVDFKMPRFKKSNSISGNTTADQTVGVIEKDMPGVKSKEADQKKDPSKEEETQSSTVKKPVEKKEKEEKQEEGVKPSDDNKVETEKENKITALGEEHNNALGTGIKAKKDMDLQPTHFIGTQKRSILENGQQVVELNIDKDAWLKAAPDKHGMLKVSLYDAKSTSKDAFSETVLMIPKDKVQSLTPDENGRLKLIVAEDQPGKKNTEIKVFEDTEINRTRIVAKNPNPLGDTPDLQKERALDAKLEHGFYGYKMDISMRDIKNEMTPAQQVAIDKMSASELKGVVDNPANSEKYTMYEEKLAEKQMQRFKEGAPMEIKGELIGKEDQAKVTFEKDRDNMVVVKDESGKQHMLNEDDLKKGTLNKQDLAGIKKETLKEIGSEIDLSVSQKKQQEQAMDTKIGEKTTYKDYVDNMSPQQQGEIKSKTGEEIKDTVSEDKNSLKNNEKNVLDGKTISKDGEKIDKPDPSKELSKAIFSGKKEDVDKLLSSGVSVEKNHIKLIKEMKDEGLKIDPGIEKAIKQAMPEPSTKVRM